MRRLRVRPKQAAGKRVITSAGFALGALLLREGARAHHRPPGPAGPNGLTPENSRRVGPPVALERRAVKHRRAVGAEELPEIDGLSGHRPRPRAPAPCRRQQGNRSRPTPFEYRRQIPAHSPRAKESRREADQPRQRERDAQAHPPARARSCQPPDHQEQAGNQPRAEGPQVALLKRPTSLGAHPDRRATRQNKDDCGGPPAKASFRTRVGHGA